MTGERLSINKVLFITSFFVLFFTVSMTVGVYLLTGSERAVWCVFFFCAAIWGCLFFFLFYVRRKLVMFSKSICMQLEKMMQWDMEPPVGVTKETLLDKINYRLARVYEVMQESRSNIRKEQKELQELISDVSHQIKTPITNLKMVNSTLLEQGMEEEEWREFLMASQGQLDKLEFLIQAMVKTSRLETGMISLDKKKQGIYETLADSLGGIFLLAEQKNLKVTVDCPEEVTLFHDRKWTSEALFNILDNAVKYTPAEGAITVSVKEWDMYLKIDIADTGIGIEEAHQGMVFKRFYREKNVCDVEGIGIGLYLAREIISLQGGYIKVSARPDKGSIFSIYLPYGEW